MTNQSPFEPVKHLLTRLGVYTSSPIAFLVLILYAALWYVLKPETFEWHASGYLGHMGHDARYPACRASRYTSHPRQAR